MGIRRDRFIVVVGIDFTPESERALAVACSIASSMPEAEVHAVHAVAAPVHPFVLEVVAHVDLAADRERLQALCDRYRGYFRVFVVPHLVLDDPEVALPELARERNADLIVIGTHDRTGLERLLLGSVAERIQRRAPCSVLLLRTRDGATVTAAPEPDPPGYAVEHRV